MSDARAPQRVDLAPAYASASSRRSTRVARRYQQFTIVARRFFAVALVFAAPVIVLAPLAAVRSLGIVAFTCAALGLAWQLIASSYDAERKLHYAKIESRLPDKLSLPLGEAGAP